MSRRKYMHIKELAPEILKMREIGMCNRAIADHFGLEIEQVKELLKNYRRRERKIAVRIAPRPKVRPRKDATPSAFVTEHAYEINRLTMKTNCCGIFCSTQERSEAAGQIPNHLYKS